MKKREYEDYYWLNEEARKFLERGYLKPGQTAEQRIKEIADRAAEVAGNRNLGEKFQKYMAKGWFSLASPIWANYGAGRGLPISCNGSYIPDSMEGILSKNSEIGMMTKHGAGTSAYFGDLRHRGAPIKDGGKSMGSVHFMELFDKTTTIVSQSNVRRGQCAAYLPVEHPDIKEFLQIRTEGHPIQKLSIGVCIGDEWMESMVTGDQEKREVWTEILKLRFETGYPYLFFTDTVNNGAPQVFKDKGLKIHASNLCVTGDQRVPTDRGMLTVRDLYKEGGSFKVFDGHKVVESGEMRMIFPEAETLTLTLDSGLSHSVTVDHEVMKYVGEGEYAREKAGNLEIGDRIRVQHFKGIFGSKTIDSYEYRLPCVPQDIWLATEKCQRHYLDLVDDYRENIYPNFDFAQDIALLWANLGVRKYITVSSGGMEGYSLYSRRVFQDHAAVVSIAGSVSKEPVYCCTVDSEEHLWVCNGVVTSNCSEIALPSYEDSSFVCCLSSLNLLHYDEWKDTDAVEVLTAFLDTVISEYVELTRDIPYMEAARKFADDLRAIGIGVLGWHSYLQSKMIPFESMEAKLLTTEIFKTMQLQSNAASEHLARRYGEPRLLEGYGKRNATLMAVAPTASSSFILGQVSASIEPLASNYFTQDLDRIKSTYKNPYLEELLVELGQDNRKVWTSILDHGGSVQHLEFLSQEQKDVFKTFAEISQREIVVQAAIRQKFIDQAQSLNLMIPHDASPKQVSELLIEGWSMGVKTFYYQKGTNPSQNLSQNLNTCKVCEA